mmetsp:Transcript_12145/g.32638  ORF Transcript_12145/g.32638 Transcript_12145/m.32638 type:complete len:208 (+) Transcript_12145:241-864(+)
MPGRAPAAHASAWSPHRRVAAEGSLRRPRAGRAPHARPHAALLQADLPTCNLRDPGGHAARPLRALRVGSWRRHVSAKLSPRTCASRRVSLGHLAEGPAADPSRPAMKRPWLKVRSPHCPYPPAIPAARIRVSRCRCVFGSACPHSPSGSLPKQPYMTRLGRVHAASAGAWSHHRRVASEGSPRQPSVGPAGGAHLHAGLLRAPPPT